MGARLSSKRAIRSSGLSETEIDKMVKDAEAHAKEDDDKKARVEARNQLDNLVYQVEKDSAEWGDKLSDATRSRLEGELNAARAIQIVPVLQDGEDVLLDGHFSEYRGFLRQVAETESGALVHR